jgi:hypothetical protein
VSNPPAAALPEREPRLKIKGPMIATEFESICWTGSAWASNDAPFHFDRAIRDGVGGVVKEVTQPEGRTGSDVREGVSKCVAA